MNRGVIRVANHDGVYVIKMEGDVRLTLCISFDDFINNMFGADNFCSVMFDLCDSQAIDSTTLGLMAKISIGARALGYEMPIVVSNNPSITRLLVSMGFDDIFNIVGETNMKIARSEGGVLAENITPVSDIQRKVLEAHQTLVQLNARNANTFKELIESLENQEYRM